MLLSKDSQRVDLTAFQIYFVYSKVLAVSVFGGIREDSKMC